MEVRWFAWFETKHEKTEFTRLLNGCVNDIEAISKVMNKYPNLSVDQAKGLVENFKNEINKNETK